jgi:hypothetical protein
MRPPRSEPRLRRLLLVATTLALAVVVGRAWARYRHCHARARAYAWTGDLYEGRHLGARDDARGMRREIRRLCALRERIGRGGGPSPSGPAELADLDGLIQMWEREAIMRDREADYFGAHAGSYHLMALRFREVAGAPWLPLPDEPDPPPFD